MKTERPAAPRTSTEPGFDESRGNEGADLPGVMTVAEAAAYLRISRGSAYEAARRGQLPTIRIGRRLLVPRAALDRLLAETTGSASEGGSRDR